MRTNPRYVWAQGKRIAPGGGKRTERGFLHVVCEEKKSLSTCHGDEKIQLRQRDYKQKSGKVYLVRFPESRKGKVVGLVLKQLSSHLKHVRPGAGMHAVVLKYYFLLCVCFITLISV